MGDITGLTPADFDTTELGGDGWGPPVVAVAPLNANTVRLTLGAQVEPATWTVVTHLDSGTQVRLGFLPGDANGDGTTAANDITRLVDYVNGVATPVWGVASSDIDRSGVVGAPDITRLVDLLNGAGAYEPYLNVSLPSLP